MLFHVQMTLTIPPDMDPDRVAGIRAAEQERALELQRQGRLLHLWRVVGRREVYSVFDVASNDELHQVLADLPLFPYMDMTVVPLGLHPSSLAGGEKQ